MVTRMSVPTTTVRRSSARVSWSRSKPSSRDHTPTYADGAYCAWIPPTRSSIFGRLMRPRASSNCRARSARLRWRCVRTRSAGTRREASACRIDSGSSPGGHKRAPRRTYIPDRSISQREDPTLRRLLATAVVVAAALAVAPSADARSGPPPLTYAVIGDTPYGARQIANFPNDVGEINADPNVQRVIHLGDIKNGSTECSTSYFEQIRADFDLFKDPLVYTPGDNKWTDCHRANNGGYWPASPVLNGDTRPARLSEIHRLFFDQPGRTLGERRERVQTQGGNYVENVAWDTARVEWGTLNVPGSNNDWAPWFGLPQTQSQIDEVTSRTNADLAWLGHLFHQAKHDDARAVVTGIQADMWDPAIEGDPAQYDHFQPIVQALASQARAFHGE